MVRMAPGQIALDIRGRPCVLAAGGLQQVWILLVASALMKPEWSFQNINQVMPLPYFKSPIANSCPSPSSQDKTQAPRADVGPVKKQPWPSILCHVPSTCSTLAKMPLFSNWKPLSLFLPSALRISCSLCLLDFSLKPHMASTLLSLSVTS